MALILKGGSKKLKLKGAESALILRDGVASAPVAVAEYLLQKLFQELPNDVQPYFENNWNNVYSNSTILLNNGNACSVGSLSTPRHVIDNDNNTDYGFYGLISTIQPDGIQESLWMYHDHGLSPSVWTSGPFTIIRVTDFSIISAIEEEDYIYVAASVYIQWKKTGDLYFSSNIPIYLIKIDKISGDVEDAITISSSVFHTYGIRLLQEANLFLKSDGTGIYVALNRASAPYYGTRPTLCKFDYNLNLLWQNDLTEIIDDPIVGNFNSDGDLILAHANRVIKISVDNSGCEELWYADLAHIDNYDLIPVDVLIDAEDNIVVTGDYLTDPSSPNIWQKFIVKLDKDGEFIWQRQGDGEFFARGNSTCSCIDSSGSVYLLSERKWTPGFNPVGMVISKYLSDGSHAYTKWFKRSEEYISLVNHSFYTWGAWSTSHDLGSRNISIKGNQLTLTLTHESYLYYDGGGYYNSDSNVGFQICPIHFFTDLSFISEGTYSILDANPSGNLDYGDLIIEDLDPGIPDFSDTEYPISVSWALTGAVVEHTIGNPIEDPVLVNPATPEKISGDLGEWPFDPILTYL